MKKIGGYIFAMLIGLCLTNNPVKPFPAYATALPPATTGGAIGNLSTLGSGYTVLADTNLLSFSFGSSPLNTGTVVEAVLSGLSSNPYIGGLSFLYQVYVVNGSIEQLSASNFKGVLMDVEQASSGFGIAQMGDGSASASTADRSVDGSVVAFDWPGAAALMIGNTSYVEIINTDATSYSDGVIGLSYSGSSGSLAGFAPSVPEPSTLLFLGSGLTGLGLWTWKRYKG